MSTKIDHIAGIDVWRQHDDSVTWESGMTLDADGSPHAYAPPPLRGLDALGNAGSPGNWYGLVCDAYGKPYVQGRNDPAPGFYVSSTSLQDATKEKSDPLRYVDSEQVAFIVIPGGATERWGVKLGDLARVEHGPLFCWAIVADIGPKKHIGEASIKCARMLGINADARVGGVERGVCYTIYPGSGTGKPLTSAEISDRARLVGRPESVAA